MYRLILSKELGWTNSGTFMSSNHSELITLKSESSEVVFKLGTC